MPRKGRGGARQGSAGTAYGNRTDLNMPISTVPGQDYGKASQQRAAQQAVPMGASPVSAPAQAPAQQPVQNRPAPGSLPYLEPSQRPDEPVTSGLPFGPGPGPEALGPQRPNSVSNALSAFGQGQDAFSSIHSLAAIARSLGI
jgi:hypothetical protein